MPASTILFVSTMEGEPWGGSEELWAGTAKYLVNRGVNVKASVHVWLPPHPRIQDLSKCGIDVRPRTAHNTLWRLARRKLTGQSVWPRWVVDLERLIAEERPALIVLSDGTTFPSIDVLELIACEAPFVTIAHNNCESWWPLDDLVPRYRRALSRALRCYFVSEAGKQLAEKMLWGPLENSSIIRNPFNVPFDTAPPWPPLTGDDELRLACVGRLDPRHKGQDVLLEALAQPTWLERKWRLTLYGDGLIRRGIESLIRHWNLGSRVSIAGHVDGIEAIWAENHALVQPSRHEGLPLSIVEAMLCARPVIATAIGGHAEVVADGVTGFLAEAPTWQSVGEALERAWRARLNLEQMGKNAAERIRRMVPRDPVAFFATELLGLLGK